VKVFPKFL